MEAVAQRSVLCRSAFYSNRAVWDRKGREVKLDIELYRDIASGVDDATRKNMLGPNLHPGYLWVRRVLLPIAQRNEEQRRQQQ